MPLLSIFHQIDLSVLFFINHQLANPVFDFVFKFLHYANYYLLGLLVLYFIFRKKNYISILLIAAVIVSFAASFMIKTYIPRERPYQVLDVRQLVNEDDNKSFPSNHTQLSFALSTIVFAFNRRFGKILLILSAIVGFGRIYIGVHYPSDVLAGAIIGIVIALLILELGIIYKRRSRVKG